MDQAAVSDRLLVVDTQFTLEETHLDRTLPFVPDAASLKQLALALGGVRFDRGDRGGSLVPR
ncbi:MAG: hypothetical protein U0794_06815 [Isosphaeraceae bacterium]